MAEPYIGEIKMFAGNYPPRNWAFCTGQLLSVPQNEALFSLIGTIYGGDGRSSFGLPDLRGRIPVHYGQGPGLKPIPIGARYGVERVTLNSDEMPVHNHLLQASSIDADSTNPSGKVLAKTNIEFYGTEAAPTKIAKLDESAVSDAGDDGSHNNVQPYLCLNFIISLKGIYPTRN